MDAALVVTVNCSRASSLSVRDQFWVFWHLFPIFSVQNCLVSSMSHLGKNEGQCMYRRFSCTFLLIWQITLTNNNEIILFFNPYDETSLLFNVANPLKIASLIITSPFLLGTSLLPNVFNYKRRFSQFGSPSISRQKYDLIILTPSSSSNLTYPNVRLKNFEWYVVQELFTVLMEKDGLALTERLILVSSKYY
jgi:hypothetical protein